MCGSRRAVPHSTGTAVPSDRGDRSSMTIQARRRLRLGMVGGGLGGNIGRSHRAAALLDGRWDLVAGALSRDPAGAAASASRWLIDPDRSYPDYRTMAEREAGREDRVDAVTICTRNDTHHPVARAFLDRASTSSATSR